MLIKGRDPFRAMRTTGAWVSTFFTMWKKLVSRREGSSYKRQRQESRQHSTSLCGPALSCPSCIHVRFSHIFEPHTVWWSSLQSFSYYRVIIHLKKEEKIIKLKVLQIPQDFRVVFSQTPVRRFYAGQGSFGSLLKSKRRSKAFSFLWMEDSPAAVFWGLLRTVMLQNLKNFCVY